MKIKLVSDFTDYYDHHFDLEGNIFRRVTTDGLDRIGILEYLEKLEFTVPVYGTVNSLKLKPDDLIVVHHNLRAHRGEEKELFLYQDALENYPESLGVKYIPFHADSDIPENTKGLSWRYLQIGVESFWLQYSSVDDWRSNCGDCQIKLSFRDKTELFSDHQYDDLLIFKYPLFAVDFVPTKDKLYAVDFNIAPGVRGSGVENILNAKEAALSIRTAYEILHEEHG